jgi:DNA-directed RNA polymerase specialized sigma24 family protein
MFSEVPAGSGLGPDFGRLRQAVARVVRKWVRCVHLAEDLVSEAVGRAWQTFGYSLPWERLVGWTVRVAQRLVIAWHRVARRTRFDASVELDALPAQEADNMVDVNDSTAHALSRLAPGLHNTLRLLVAGASTEEIAAGHGLTARGARKRVAKLRDEFRTARN